MGQKDNHRDMTGEAQLVFLQCIKSQRVTDTGHEEVIECVSSEGVADNGCIGKELIII